ncbi:hypothetical protein [Pseudoalteromonas byunsanensis]|uniref:Fimbrial assembly protein n=1 Tax=Pseudoalteromonas byunsanensis TaxID=327939 RepID=A0A1S1N7H0_9GAMM|nr:hypothetical protein [Pseudoalteromonas byunsanensis]OHU95289.1 hypothetical protein BIW53_11260 [Pseudoalteromonas byunsanensis]
MLANRNINDASEYLVHKKFFLNRQKELIEVQNNAPKIKLAEACVIDRDLFWATTRYYPKSSLKEIFNIVKAQSKELPPFEGMFLWRARNFGAAQFSIDYFVIPKESYELIPKSCQFVLPLYNDIDEHNQWPLTMSYTSDEMQEAEKTPLPWLDLIGLRVKREKTKAQQRLSTTHLVYGLLATGVLTVTSLSGYIYWTKMSLQSAKTLNQAQVNESLEMRQKYNREVNSTAELQTFFKQNPNVLSRLASLNLNSQGIIFDRVTVTPKGVELRGVTDKSATDLLKQLVASDVAKEAKFSGPVVKQKTGGEGFTIEVEWL